MNECEFGFYISYAAYRTLVILDIYNIRYIYIYNIYIYSTTLTLLPESVRSQRLL